MTALSTITAPTPHVAAPPRRGTPPLVAGDRLTRDEFLRRYKAMPHLNKAELIDGRVYMPPISHEGHSGPTSDLGYWLASYRIATPGVDSGDNGTVLLDLDNAPQPDNYLFVRPEHGGQVEIDADGFIDGGPELVAEVAATSASYDLHEKLHAYRRNGVKEYIVLRTRDRALDWFILRGSVYERLEPGEDGIHRSETFPGLWLDAAALIGRDMKRVSDMGALGLASDKHGEFIKTLPPAKS